MKEGIYWVTLFIHVTIYASLSFFVCPDALPEEVGFEHTQLREKIKELIGNDASSKLSASKKLELAYTYFWLGHLQNTIAILEPENRDEFTGYIDNLGGPLGSGHQERAQVSLYLGYSYLSLGDESKAYKNFVNAFRSDPDLELDKEVLEKDEYLASVIKDAEIFAQMERKFWPLDLFVAVDVSKSVSKKQVDQIKKLQREVKARLKSDDEFFFYRFGNSPNRSASLTPASSSDSIIKSLRTDLWTDFRALFQELGQIIEEYSENPTERQKAVLIISDGEHSVQDDLGGREARIPPNVTNAIKTFSEAHPNVPIVIITTDRVLQTGTIQSGSFYTARWTKELEEHSAGKSFYYSPGSKPEEILTQAFDIIESYRDKVFITLDRSEKKRYSFNKEYKCTVEVVVRCMLPNVDLMVTGHPDWETDSDLNLSSLFCCKWEETDKNTISIKDSTARRKNLIISCLNTEEAFRASHEPRQFTLTFSRRSAQDMNQDEVEIRKISLFFKQKLPAIEITKEFNKKVVMKSNAENPLKFQSKIDLPNHLKEPILLSVKVDDTKCFYGHEQKKIIPVDTTGSPGRNEFDLLIKTKRVDKFWSKIPDDNIPISFETSDSGTAYDVDANQVGKIDFRVVRYWLYFLYHANGYAWILFVAILIIYFVLYPFFYDRIRTITYISGEGFKVSGNTIYDSKGKQVVWLQQKWWSVTFEFAEISLKSGIETAKLFWQRSGKEKVDENKKINLSSHKHHMKRKRTYTIILSEDGNTESEFNAYWNYRLPTWHKIVKWAWILLGICAAILVGARIYVSWPLSALQTNILIFSVIFMAVYVYSKLMKSRRNNDSHLLGNLAELGRAASWLEGLISLIEHFIHLLPI